MFEFIKLKQKFFFDTYRLLIDCSWPHRILVYDGDPEYYTIITIVFKDEKNYFRHMEMPLPILQQEADEGEFQELAKHILEQISKNAGHVKHLSREIWGKIPIRDVYEMIS